MNRYLILLHVFNTHCVDREGNIVLADSSETFSSSKDILNEAGVVRKIGCALITSAFIQNVYLINQH